MFLRDMDNHVLTRYGVILVVLIIVYLYINHVLLHTWSKLLSKYTKLFQYLLILCNLIINQRLRLTVNISGTKKMLGVYYSLPASDMQISENC